MNNLNNIPPKGYETPLTYVIGVLCLAISIIPIIIGISQSITAMRVGIVIAVIGAFLLFLGRMQKNKLIKKITEKNK